MLERRPLRLAGLIVVLVPVGLLAGRLLMSGVNIPYMDQWEVADLVVKAFNVRSRWGTSHRTPT